MKKTKKFLSLVLAVIMIVCTVPIAYAEDSTTYEVGDIIQFGSYPQSEVKDEALLAELNARAPEWASWISYGYYRGNGDYGSMVQGDWMRYTDINYNSEKYRGVKFTKNRMDTTYSNAYGEHNGYSIDTVYWFKFEPIDWRIIDPKSGFVVCKTIIDSQPYSNTVYEAGFYGLFINDTGNEASDYETSSIRKWLNNEFYNVAFTDSEKKEICTTSFKNNETFDGYLISDKIFLLSYDEITDSSLDSYTFLRAKGSEYAQIHGLYVRVDSLAENNGMSPWILRSPGSGSLYCSGVSYNRYIGTNYNVCKNSNGIRPSFKFNDISNIGQTNEDKPASGDSVVSGIPSESTKDCSCNCHAGGIAGLIFKIINFFQKLFGQNKVCACGVNH